MVFSGHENTKLYVLPFLGEVQELSGERSAGKTTFIIPEVSKGMVAWWAN
jgi:hypothetical protein